jgi:hypothetical protein
MKELIDNFLIKEDAFFECMIIEYIYLENKNSFVWIGKPGLFFRNESHESLFIKLEFLNVSELKHFYPNHKNALKNFEYKFLANDSGKTFESESSETYVSNDLYNIIIKMDYLMGSIEFKFLALKVELLKASYVNENYYNNGQIIDFYHPFGII